MKPRYYDIDDINSKNTGSKKKIIIIIAAVLIGSALLFAGGISFATTSILNAASTEKQAKMDSASENPDEIPLGDILRDMTVTAIVEQESIPAYTTDEIYNLDLSKPSGVSVADLKLCTKASLCGLEEAFWQAEQDYGINCLFVMAIASHESANGTICFRKNNMFGFGTTGFATKAEGIDVVSRTLANKYLSPSGSLYKGNTVEAVHKRYAASPTWDDKVVKNMVRYYSIISENHKKAIEALK